MGAPILGSLFIYYQQSMLGPCKERIGRVLNLGSDFMKVLAQAVKTSYSKASQYPIPRA